MNSRGVVVGTALAVMASMGIASTQTLPTVDSLVSAAKNAAGLDWAGTFLRLCVVPPPAAPGAGGAANAAPAAPPAKASWHAEPAKVADNFYSRTRIHNAWPSWAARHHHFRGAIRTVGA
jgi:hypothetical protein